MESDSESEAAFSMVHNSDSVESDVFGDGDWFDEVAKIDSGDMDWFSEEEEVESTFGVSDNDSLEDSPLSDTSDVVLATAKVANPENRLDAFV